MRKLRDQGLSAKQLNIVFDAIILSRIMYGVCAWSGCLLNSLVALTLFYDECLDTVFLSNL